eukprot:gnl/MRDRNA2_/MRDRNA2_108957_c0_seq1.p1 gnl/MRDRNA2_/MRDRNA2_108957_c0~~gnl/MRDRNA2_/MRDRNA2_108957_c0_seq1.p1  ORF type:complete len:481 (+),score=107.53 gnl/MRDRNA2_/MRDRNA2_108957_c0_seq1:34-1476(+)
MEDLVREGPLRVVWLAAHWWKKLRQHDFIHADVRKAVRQVLENQAWISLRYTGHLLLGSSKVYNKKFELFEIDALEFRSKLILANFDQIDAKRPNALKHHSEFQALGDSQVFHDPEEGWTHERQNVALSKDFVADLDDITFKTKPVVKKPQLPFDGMSDAFSSLEGEEKEEFDAFMVDIMKDMDFHGATKGEAKEMLETPEVRPLLGADQGDLLKHLGIVNAGAEPCSLDIPPPDEEAKVHQAKSKPEVPADAQEGAPAKKRRLQKVIVDNHLSLPRTVFKESPEITQHPAVDFTVYLSHSMPPKGHTTTLGSICPALAQTLNWGKITAARHRKDSAEAEDSNLVSKATVSVGPGMIAKEAGISSAAQEDHDVIFEALPPASMADVLKASPLTHEKQEVTKSGYSARTERMESWLQKKFETDCSKSLSYSALCKEERLSAQHCREVKASCFFELLVLRTNSMIRLKQDRPYGDIQIGHEE